MVLTDHLHLARDGEKGIGHAAMEPLPRQLGPPALITMMGIDPFVGHVQLYVPVHPYTVTKWASSNKRRTLHSFVDA